MKSFSRYFALLILIMLVSCQQPPDVPTPISTPTELVPSPIVVSTFPSIEPLFNVTPTVTDFSKFLPITADNASNLKPFLGITQDIVYDVAWSLDGKFIAAATSHGLNLYSSNSLKVKPVNLSPFLARSSLVASSPTGTMMAWTETDNSGDTGLWLWNLVENTKNFIPIYDLQDITFSSDGSLLAGAIYKVGVQVWDTKSRKAVASFTSAGGANDVDFSPDGRLLVSSGHRDLMAHLWNIDTGEEKGTIGDPNMQLTRVAFKPSSGILALGYTGAVQLWDVNNKIEAEYSRVINDAFMSELVFSPTGNFLAVPIYSGSKLYVLDSALKRIAELEVGPYANNVAFSPDEETLAVVSNSGLKLFDTSTWQPRDSLPPRLGRVQKMVFRSDKPLLVSIHEDGIAAAWDLRAGAEISRISSLGKHFLSPDGKLLAVGADNGEVSVWDIDTGTLLKSYQRASKWGVSDITFSQDNRVLTISYPDEMAWSVVFWELESDQEPRVFILDNGLVYIGALTPDGRKLAVQIWENEISVNVGVWDTQTREMLWISKRGEGSWISSVAIDPNNKILAVGDRWDGAISLYDTNTGRSLETFNEPSGFLDYAVVVNDIIFSNNGKLMVTIINGGAVVWDLEKHTFIDIDRSCSKPIESLVFSQDDSLLMIAGGTNLATNITGSGGRGGVCIWEMQTGRLLSSAGWEDSGTSNFATFNQDRTMLAIDDNSTIWLWGIFK